MKPPYADRLPKRQANSKCFGGMQGVAFCVQTKLFIFFYMCGRILFGLFGPAISSNKRLE